MRCMSIRESDLCCVMGGWRPWTAIQVSHADLQRLKGFTAVCALVPCGAFPVGICQRRPGTVPEVREDTIASQARHRDAQRRPFALAAGYQKWRQYLEAAERSHCLCLSRHHSIKKSCRSLSARCPSRQAAQWQGCMQEMLLGMSRNKIPRQDSRWYVGQHLTMICTSLSLSVSPEACEAFSCATVLCPRRKADAAPTTQYRDQYTIIRAVAQIHTSCILLSLWSCHSLYCKPMQWRSLITLYVIPRPPSLPLH